MVVLRSYRRRYLRVLLQIELVAVTQIHSILQLRLLQLRLLTNLRLLSVWLQLLLHYHRNTVLLHFLVELLLLLQFQLYVSLRSFIRLLFIFCHHPKLLRLPHNHLVLLRTALRSTTTSHFLLLINLSDNPSVGWCRLFSCLGLIQRLLLLGLSH